METLKCIRITVKHWTIRDGVIWICCLLMTYIVRGDYIQSIRVGRCETVSILISLLLQSRYPPLIPDTDFSIFVSPAKQKRDIYTAFLAATSSSSLAAVAA